MTVVLDASAIVEMLLATFTGTRIQRRARTSTGDLHIPHIADLEVTSVLRRMVLAGEISAERAARSLDLMSTIPTQRWPSDQMLARIWQLRDRLTPYDAAYVALAEALDATLLTCDARLARGASGATDCEIVVYPQSS